MKYNILLFFILISVATSITVNKKSLNGNTILQITTDNNTVYNYNLNRNYIKSSDYRVYIDNIPVIIDDQHKHYTGYGVNNNNSLLVMTETNLTFNGIFEVRQQNYTKKTFKLSYTDGYGYEIGDALEKYGLDLKNYNTDFLEPDEDFNELPINSSNIEENLSDTKYVELLVISDKSRLDSVGGDMTKVVKSTESIVNVISSIYRNSQLTPKVEIILSSQIVWTGMPIEPTFVGTEIMASKYMNDMYTYVYSNRATLPKYDNVMLLTGYDLEGSTIGIARVCSMCTLSSSGSLVMAAINTKNTDAYIASIGAHEMGHNFCMSHDNADADTTAVCTAKKYLMSPSASRSSPATEFSSCSINYYNTKFLPKYNSNPSIQCLENNPGISTPIPTATNLPTSTPIVTSTPTVRPNTPTPTSTVRPNTPTPTASIRPTSTQVPTINPITPIPTNTASNSPTGRPTTVPNSQNRCGVNYNWANCRNNDCCSRWGYCNANGDLWCSRANGCQMNCKS